MTLQVVLDCSAFMALPLEEKEAKLVEPLISDKQVVVPKIWLYEVANILCTCVKSNRISKQKAQATINSLEVLEIVYDSPSIENLDLNLKLALKHSLTVYDASYLELAIRLNLPLITFDKKLKKVATDVGIKVLV